MLHSEIILFRHWQAGFLALSFFHMIQTPPLPSLAWCLFLDVDGTLIEFTDTPLETQADSKIKALLAEVAERLGGALALVSGRSIEYLDALFEPLRLPVAGLHGVQRRGATGVVHGPGDTDAQLDLPRRAIKALVAANPGTSLEDKGRTIAIHYRLSPRSEHILRDSLAIIAAPLGTRYHIQDGNMVLEIKPSGYTKATAIAAFLAEPPFSGRMPVFVGDDLTDQDGFRVVEEKGGISIAVGNRVRGQYNVENAAAVRQWLQGIAAMTTTDRE